MVILIWGLSSRVNLGRVNLGRFLAFSLIRCSDAIVTIVHCERPSWEGEVWVRKLMEIIGVPWMIVLIMPPTIIVFLIGFTFFDEIEATSRYSYLKWAIRFLCSMGVGNNLWGLVSWFVRSGLLSITNLKLRDRMGFWFVVFEEIFGRTGRKERVAIRDELSI